MLLLGLMYVADLLDGLLDGAAQVFHVYGFRGEVEGTFVHRQADVPHVAVCTYHDDAHGGIAHLIQLSQQRQTVHLGHVDVAEDDLNVRVVGQYGEGLQTIAGEEELIFTSPDLTSEVLFHQKLNRCFVVHA